MEEIYNIFGFIDDGKYYTNIGCFAHRISGSDQNKFDYLRSAVDSDIEKCIVLPLTEKISKAESDAFGRLYGSTKILEEACKAYDIPSEALLVFTPVKNGKAIFDISIDLENNSLEARRELMGVAGNQVDWLEHYQESGTIDISALINDDFYKAIRITFQEGLYLSSMKLLMSCIDSLAYIEYGTKDAFIRWLTEYAELDEVIKVSPEELWELRNGILHMSNLKSHKVEQGKVKRISFCVGLDKAPFYYLSEGIHYFDLKQMIKLHSEAIKKWIKTYNEMPQKFEKFVERYDEMLSDSRFFYSAKR